MRILFLPMRLTHRFKMTSYLVQCQFSLLLKTISRTNSPLKCVGTFTYGVRLSSVTFHHWCSLLSLEVAILLKNEIDPVTQLYTMTSSLEYKTTKADIQMPFTCSVTYYGPSGQKTIHSEQAVFDIYCK